MTSVDFFFGSASKSKNAGIFARVRTMFAVAQQRKVLANLDDTRLDDLGISRSRANAEAARSIWDLPRR